MLNLLTIAYQDISSRMVWWFLFPLTGALGGYLFISHVSWAIYPSLIGINLVILTIILSITYLVTRLLLKKKFLNKSFGLGDLLFLSATALSFPPVSFLVLFLFATVFTLAVHRIVGRNTKITSIPAAGYMAIFFAAVYLISWLGLYENLYTI